MERQVLRLRLAVFGPPLPGVVEEVFGGDLSTGGRVHSEANRPRARASLSAPPREPASGSGKGWVVRSWCERRRLALSASETTTRGAFARFIGGWGLVGNSRLSVLSAGIPDDGHGGSWENCVVDGVGR